MTGLQNKMPKGSYGIAHIQKSGYSLLAGHYGYSRFFVVKVTKATRDGEAKAFIDWEGDTAPTPVDRYTTMYAAPAGYPAATIERAFKAQALDFTGYETKEQLRAALDAQCGAA